MFKLGVTVTDKATQLTGALMVFFVSASQKMYSFQPKALSPETGQPVDQFWMDTDRVVGGVDDPDAPEIPVAALGTKAKTGGAFGVKNFDIRLLEGPGLTKLEDTALADSKRQRPSPGEYTRPVPRL
jgi:hypothetical protein